MHREIAEVGGTYTLREGKEVYPCNFTSETAALMLSNNILWEKS